MNEQERAADAPTPHDFIYRFVPAQHASPALETYLLLHGTGGDENDLLPLGQMLAGDAQTIAFLSPRGRVLENGAPRFFRRLAEGIFDEADLRRRTQELAGFIEQAVRKYKLDARNITAIGYSNGANIAASLLLLRPGILRRAVLLHAMVPLVPDVLPNLKGTKIFLAAGRLDPIIAPDTTARLAAMLKQAQAEVEIFWHAGGHELRREEVERARVWLATEPQQQSVTTGKT
ncbi:MAG: alpha/beta hydrolase [Pyrinomonadaceae bacterium]